MRILASRIGSLMTISFLFASCFTFGNIEDRITKTFPVNYRGTLVVQSDNGRITVQGVESKSVAVEIIREVRTTSDDKANEILRDFDIQFDHAGDDVTIKAKYKKKGLQRLWNNTGKHLRVKFVISVPREYNVDLNTKGGSISVEHIRGEVLSKTSGGSLQFDDIDGDISGDTSGGSISIGNVIGRSDIRTSGGSIHIKSARGPVDAHTSGGSITIEEVFGAVKVSTSGGSVKASLAHQPDSDCRLTTSGGSITVHLAEDISLDVNAKTIGGRIYTDFRDSQNGKTSKGSLQTEINGGGPELYLRTSGGSIYLNKL